MKHKHEEQDTAIDGLTECLLRVKSSHSVSKKYYHLSGWYWGKADTRHSVPVAGFGGKAAKTYRNAIGNSLFWKRNVDRVWTTIVWPLFLDLGIR